MGGVDFKPNRAFLPELMRSPGVEAVVRDAGRRVLSAASSSAPVATGDYAASLHLVSGIDRDRAKARVGSTDPAAIVIEQRTGTLRRALGSA